MSISRPAQAEPSTASSPLAAAARQELEALRSGFVTAQRRPSGATRRDRALAELATELERALRFASEPVPISSSNALPEAHELRAAVVCALRGSAAVLVGSRDAQRTALDTWAATQLNNGTDPVFALSLRLGIAVALVGMSLAFFMTNPRPDQSAATSAGAPPTINLLGPAADAGEPAGAGPEPGSRGRDRSGRRTPR